MLEQSTTGVVDNSASNGVDTFILALGDLPLVSTHPMTTRAYDGIRKPNQKYLLQVSAPPPIPTSITFALSNPCWNEAMTDEMKALNWNHTWTPVPRNYSMNLVQQMGV